MTRPGPFGERDWDPYADLELGPVLRNLDRVSGTLRDAARESARMGMARSSLYIAGAEGSLRIATAAAVTTWRRSADAPGMVCGVRLLGSSGFALRSTGVRMLAERVRVIPYADGDALEPAPDGDDLPSPCGRSLASDVLTSRALRKRARGPVFAGLLEDALARHDWWCPAAGARWSADPGGAAAIVDAASGGRWRVRLGPFDAGGLVDGRVADLMAARGWHPMAEIGLPDERTGRGAA